MAPEHSGAHHMPNRQLLLLRHAKAVPEEFGMDDFDRPLAERGRDNADAMGRYIAAQGLIPDLVLYSPARRTVETWNLAARHLPGVESRAVQELHNFGTGSALLDVIKAEGRAARRLMLVTHNPATERLAQRLSGEGEKSLLRRMAEGFPTCGLAVIDFSAGGWADTAPGTGTLHSFTRPRDLAEA